MDEEQMWKGFYDKLVELKEKGQGQPISENEEK